MPGHPRQAPSADRRSAVTSSASPPHGYDVAVTYTVSESAWNGGKDGEYRRTLQQALDHAHAGKFSVLVVWALDRITREGAEGALRSAVRGEEGAGRAPVRDRRPPGGPARRRPGGRVLRGVRPAEPAAAPGTAVGGGRRQEHGTRPGVAAPDAPADGSVVTRQVGAPAGVSQSRVTQRAISMGCAEAASARSKPEAAAALARAGGSRQEIVTNDQLSATL
jgi:Resolvase, N terminal domain